MKTRSALNALVTLMMPSLVLAHGEHSAMPFESLAHLLTHHWPVMVGVIGIAVLYRIKKSSARSS